jgi:transcriptional regulator with XRE-family HTH domain
MVRILLASPLKSSITCQSSSLILDISAKVLLDMETFGKWLAHHRKKAGLTQDGLGKRAGCTGAYISSLERDVVESKSGRPIQPSIELVDAIARGLGVPQSVARKAAGYDSASPEDNKTEKQLLAYFRDLSIDGQSIALALLQTLHSREMTILQNMRERSNLGLKEGEELQELPLGVG